MSNNSNILYDCHIHSNFSSDSKELPENIIDKALSLGLKGICFTDHNDYDYPLEDGKVVFLLDFDTYFNSILKLKEKYADKLDILIGIEQGLMKSVSDKVNAFDQSKCLDFIIGSSHLINGDDPYYKEYWDNKPVKEVVNLYYESILENIKTCDNFDVYGHIDYILRYAPGQDRDYDWKNNRDIIDEILKQLVERGKGIEINTAGLKYGLSYPNPRKEILSMYKSHGGEIITVGSDSHFCDYLGYEFEAASSMLLETGFRYYSIFRSRKPEFVKL